MDESDLKVFQSVQTHITKALSDHAAHKSTLPTQAQLTTASTSLHKVLPAQGHGLEATTAHLLQDVAPGLNNSSLSPTYYGFVTGGITPAARIADNLATLHDQNVSVHLPAESAATIVEDRALSLLLQLFNFEPSAWPARSFTTGATAGNILGLACGREFVVTERLRKRELESIQGEGLLSACSRAGIEQIQILTTIPHSSLGKAANIVGIGSASVINVARKDTKEFLQFDFEKLEQHLQNPRAVSIVAVSCGEVNTGLFATSSAEDLQRLRALCDTYGAWLHVDAAFGLFARVLPDTPQYATVRAGAAGLEHADSIGGDAHKLLNVPYDCGFFFAADRRRDIPWRVFCNANAAYLAAPPSSTSEEQGEAIASPLNVRLENSARFRGLPVYATLLAYGRAGYSDMVVRMVELARAIARFIRDECPALELLPANTHDEQLQSVYMCVLFRARDAAKNETLTERIKATRRAYASGTAWEGRPAVRFAVAKWDGDVARDLEIVKEVLKSCV